MSKIMRKTMSVLLAICLLCGILPMGGMLSVGAAVNKIKNSTFDNGTSNWDGNAAIALDAGALKATCDAWDYAKTTTDYLATNTDYVLSFKCKSDSATNKFYINALDTSWGASGISKMYVSITTEWAEYTVEFNSGANQKLILFFQTETARTFWLDDVTLYIKNDDGNIIPDMPITAVFADGFEDGIGSWKASEGSLEVVPDSQLPVFNETGYALKHVAPSYESYPFVSDRTPFTVEPNTDYLLTFSALGTRPDVPAQAIIGENYWLDSVYSTPYIYPSHAEWTTYSFVFNSGDHTSVYMGLKSIWYDNTIYFDNVSVTRIADDGHIRNGDFDTGSDMEWTANDNVEVKVDPTGWRHGYVMQSNMNTGEALMFSQTAKNLKPNTDYKLRFLVNCYSTASQPAFWVRFPSDITNWSVDVGNTGLTSGQKDNSTPRINVYSANNALNKWHTVIIRFNSGNNTEIPIEFMNYRPDAGQYYFDDVVVYEALDPAFDGYIYNGDFEIGAEPVWELHANSYIDIQSAHDGNFGAHLLLNNSASWGGVLNQTINNLQPGCAYRITFWYKAVQQGLNWTIMSSTATLTSGYISSKKWTRESKTFVADSTTAVLNFSGSGINPSKDGYEAGKDEMLLDSVLIEYIPGTPENVIDYQGKSAMEMDGTGSVGGLGFLFSANINDFSYIEDNSQQEHSYTVYKYAENSGKVNPYANASLNRDYTVVRMGAIVSNRTGEDLTLESVDTETKRTINIVGTKAMKDWCDDTTYVYGVRVTNIPAAGFDTTIYARPYITILINSVEITLYGEVQSGTYNGVLGE